MPGNTLAKCALCKGDHPANHKGCCVYEDLLQRRNPRDKSNNNNLQVNNPNQEPIQRSPLMDCTNNPKTHISTFAQKSGPIQDQPTAQLELLPGTDRSAYYPYLAKYSEDSCSKESEYDSTNLLPNYQFGFQENTSLMHKARKNCNDVFLDVSQAFNKVWQSGLL
ncbi:hypothetical protein JTB14_027785 [Gonioctena quinquepunctata]|nr:hypothetical protein JTB14_027785 [Gonioctena quinquepunctata]